MNKQEFKSKAKKTIDDLFQEVERLENKVADTKGEAKATVQKKLDSLRQQKKELKEKYHQLEQTTEDNFETVKDAFSNGVQAFKSTLAK